MEQNKKMILTEDRNGNKCDYCKNEQKNKNLNKKK